MKDCEKIGLVKFDFLGLQTLTVLSKACEMIKQNTGKEINIDTLPVDDKKTFDEKVINGLNPTPISIYLPFSIFINPLMLTRNPVRRICRSRKSIHSIQFFK